jgi:hypothetical protein
VVVVIQVGIKWDLYTYIQGGGGGRQNKQVS